MATAHRIYAMPFASVPPPISRRSSGRAARKRELDAVICWLTGYTLSGLVKQLEKKVDIATFFDEAPAMNPKRSQVTGVVRRSAWRRLKSR